VIDSVSVRVQLGFDWVRLGYDEGSVKFWLGLDPVSLEVSGLGPAWLRLDWVLVRVRGFGSAWSGLDRFWLGCVVSDLLGAGSNRENIDLVPSLGLRVQGVGFKVQGQVFKVLDLGFGDRG
jgi:hypothetical protein